MSGVGVFAGGARQVAADQGQTQNGALLRLAFEKLERRDIAVVKINRRHENGGAAAIVVGGVVQNPIQRDDRRNPPSRQPERFLSTGV